MKKFLQQLATENKQQEQLTAGVTDNSYANDNRRSFLKKAALGGMSLAGLTDLSIEDTIAQSTSNVQRSSKP